MAAQIEAIQKGAQAGKDVVDTIYKVLDKSIDWSTFDTTMEQLKKRKAQYSNKAAEYVGTLTALLAQTKDDYFLTTATVSRWCKEVVALMGAVQHMFPVHGNVEKATASLKIFLLCLKKGATLLQEAINHLQTTLTTFNKTEGTLVTLRAQLNNDYDDSSDYFHEQVHKLRIKAYSGAIAGGVFGPIGLAISYGIAAGTVEKHLIPDLTKAFEKTKRAFDGLSNTVNDCIQKLEDAHSVIQGEIKVLEDLAAKNDITEVLGEALAAYPTGSEVAQEFLGAAKELEAVCKIYINSKVGGGSKL